MKGLDAVGDCWAMDASEVLKLGPTLLIGSVPFKTKTVEQILAQPVPFLALNPRSLADIDGDIELLGRLTGKGAAARKLIQKMHRAFERVARTARQARSKPRVYSEAWPNPRISSPPWAAELIELAGGRMAVAGGKQVTDAEVAAAQPEIIILAWTATGARSNPRRAYEVEAWKNVPAIRERRVVAIRDELLNTPGPPLIEGATALLHAVHPELVRR